MDLGVGLEGSPEAERVSEDGEDDWKSDTGVSRCCMTGHFKAV
jgi:hypothetical protein